MGEGAAIRQGDKLSECVRTFWAAKEGCMSDLLVIEL